MMLDALGLGEALLPTREVPEGLVAGGEVEVVLWTDPDDRLQATTGRPLALVGEFAALRVVALSPVGAFLDWGLPKDLLLPFAEQVRPLFEGDKELVRIHLDERSGRLVASAKINRFVEDTATEWLRVGGEVSLMIADRTDMGWKAIVDDTYWGLLRVEDASRVPAPGTRCRGYISRILLDSKVDVSLDPPGYGRIPAAVEKLEAALRAADGGFLPLHDKSAPDDVRAGLDMSKKVFKQALGALYKEGRVRLAADGTYWVE